MSYPFDRLSCDLFVRMMYTGQPGLINVCSIPYSGGKLDSGRFFPITDEGMGQVVDYAADCARRHIGSIYLRASTLKHIPYDGGRGYARDTLAVPYGWADLDYGTAGHKGEDLPPTAEDAQSLVAAAGMPEPTLWIHSGGGLYPIWKWSRALEYDEAKELVARIQHLILLASKARGWNYGAGVKDMARVLRVVGSSNMKTGEPRPCRIIGGTGQEVDPDAFPPAPKPEMIRKVSPKDAPAPRKSSAPYDPSAPRRPLDVLDELVDWEDILQHYGLSYVHDDSVGACWVRDGAASTYSLKITHNTGSAINWSEALDMLPIGVGMTKALFLAYMVGHGGDRTALLRDIMSGKNTHGVPAHVVDEMALVGAQTTTFLGVTIVHSPDQGSQSADTPAPEPVTDEDVDAFIDTFTSYKRPRALINRSQWMRTDHRARFMHHAIQLVKEAALGYYPAERAITAILHGCVQHDVDPDVAIQTALGAILNSEVSA